MKRNIEIEDDLDEIIEGAIEDVKQELLNYLEENPDTDETPCISNDLDYSGAIHEIVDGAVPIYTSHIDGLWYLYGSEFEEAYDDAGFGDKTEDNWKMGAIYCYIYQKVRNWYSREAEDIFDEWKAKHDEEEAAKEEAEDAEESEEEAKE